MRRIVFVCAVFLSQVFAFDGLSHFSETVQIRAVCENIENRELRPKFGPLQSTLMDLQSEDNKLSLGASWTSLCQNAADAGIFDDKEKTFALFAYTLDTTNVLPLLISAYDQQYSAKIKLCTRIAKRKLTEQEARYIAEKYGGFGVGCDLIPDFRSTVEHTEGISRKQDKLQRLYNFQILATEIFASKNKGKMAKFVSAMTASGSFQKTLLTRDKIKDAVKKASAEYEFFNKLHFRFGVDDISKILSYRALFEKYGGDAKAANREVAAWQYRYTVPEELKEAEKAKTKESWKKLLIDVD